MKIKSWGRLSNIEHQVDCLISGEKNIPIVKNTEKALVFGNGRSYGDVCLNPEGVLWLSKNLDHFISFDAESGILVCEAGVLLKDIQQLGLPQGWMLGVTPGTQYATVGGAIANDVHGKNHHRLGTFGNHILEIALTRTNGETIFCGPKLKADWFSATVGGLGLTGVILSVKLQLRRVKGPWVDVEKIPFNNLKEFFELADMSERGWEHTVSWVDCLSSHGRGIFMRANHSDLTQPKLSDTKKFSLSFEPPFSLVNKASLLPFNLAYYYLQKANSGKDIMHYESFFYPLDNIDNWNKMYGPKGFYQYQSVIPRAHGLDATKEMLSEIKKSGDGSFLAVLKTFGQRQSLGMLSFPEPGVTLALDFPNQGERTLRLLSRLDKIVREGGGRIYPAKDARMPRDLFESGYPRLSEFIKYRDPGMSSALSRRLLGS